MSVQITVSGSKVLELSDKINELRFKIKELEAKRLELQKIPQRTFKIEEMIQDLIFDEHDLYEEIFALIDKSRQDSIVDVRLT